MVRQESAFEPDAVSRAGARGLMQLMPATASQVAGQEPALAVSRLTRLTEDGVYNILLGRTYLETLIDDFGGSYALADRRLQRRTGAGAAVAARIRRPARRHDRHGRLDRE